MKQDSATNQLEGLVVGAEGLRCILPIGDVVETMRPLPAEKVPDAPPFVRGLAVIRGAPVPVVDLAMFLDRPATRTPGRYVTLRVGTRHVALAVGEVLGVRRISLDVLAGVPPLTQQACAAFVEAVGTLDRQLLLVLRGARLVPEELWPVIDGLGRNA